MSLKPGTCKHFNGVQHKTCLAGVCYADHKDGFPCIKIYGEGGPRESMNPNWSDCCPKRQEPTAEEVAQSRAESASALAETEKRILVCCPKDRTGPYDLWFDETAPGLEMTHAEFLKRLQDVHGIDPKVTKGTRSMVCHMDGDKWFSYIWKWEIAGKKFTNSTRQMRRGQNAAMWSGR